MRDFVSRIAELEVNASNEMQFRVECSDADCYGRNITDSKGKVIYSVIYDDDYGTEVSWYTSNGYIYIPSSGT